MSIVLTGEHCYARKKITEFSKGDRAAVDRVQL